MIRNRRFSVLENLIKKKKRQNIIYASLNLDIENLHDGSPELYPLKAQCKKSYCLELRKKNRRQEIS